MKYFWVKEFTPDSHEFIDDKGITRVSLGGERHLHILTDTRIGQKCLSNFWKEITGGESYICWIFQENCYNPAGYSTKYLTKAFQEAPYEENERRYAFSRHAQFRVRPEPLPILGDFWEIIGHPRCKAGVFNLDSSNVPVRTIPTGARYSRRKNAREKREQTWREFAAHLETAVKEKRESRMPGASCDFR